MVEQTEAIRIQLQFEADRAEKQAKSMTRQLASMERRFDPLAAATRRYDRGLKLLEKSLESGKIDVARYDQNLGELNKEFDRAKAKAAGVSKALASAHAPASGLASIMHRNRAVFQQTGYQVGDFAVQVQGGTSAVTAFTQQGSQLLGVMGPMGAVLGAVLAVGLPLGAALMRSGDGAERLAETSKELAKAVNSYVEAAEASLIPTDELVEKYGRATEAARTFGVALREIAEGQARGALDENIKALLDSFIGNDTRIVSQLNSIAEIEKKIVQLNDLATNVSTDQRSAVVLEAEAEALADLIVRAQTLSEELAITDNEALKLANSIQTLGAAEGPEKIAAAAEDLLHTLDLIFGAYAAMPPEVQKLYTDTVDAGEAAAKLHGSIEAAEGAVHPMLAAIHATANAIDIARANSDSWAASLSSAAQNAFAAANAMAVARHQAITAGPDGAVNESREKFTPHGVLRSDVVLSRTHKAKRSGRKGGSGSTQKRLNKINQDAQRIIESLKTAEEKHNEELARAKDLLDAGALSATQYKEHISQLTDELNRDKLRDFTDGLDEIAGKLLEGKNGIRDFVRSALSEFAKFQLSQGLRMALGMPLQKSGGGFLGSLLGGLLSFDGGGDTPNGPRAGGVDGKGGFPAILHPNETVIDHTKGRGSQGARGTTEIIIRHEPGTVVEIARGQAVNVVQESAPGIAGQGAKLALNRISQTRRDVSL